MNEKKKQPGDSDDEASTTEVERPDSKGPAREHGGPKGLEPTRYGDWEKNGRCYDF